MVAIDKAFCELMVPLGVLGASTWFYMVLQFGSVRDGTAWNPLSIGLSSKWFYEFYSLDLFGQRWNSMEQSL